MTKDTRTKRMVETTYTPAEFLTTLADHIPDRYRHNIRYFGLLAPRVKRQTHDAVFALLRQERLGKPQRLRWAASMKKSFGVDPEPTNDKCEPTKNPVPTNDSESTLTTPTKGGNLFTMSPV